MKKNKKIVKKFRLNKTWKLSLKIKPAGTVKGWSNLLHVTTGKNVKQYGSRIPGIWFISGTNRLHICSAISGKNNLCYNTPKSIPRGKYTKVVIRQIYVKKTKKYIYQIFINNRKVFQRENKKAKSFSNVKFYKADPWYKPAKACLKNLSFYTAGKRIVGLKPKGWFIIFF